MRKNMSELSPVSEIRLRIILSGVDVTLRLNTLECETWGMKGETQSLLNLRVSCHLKTQ